MWRIGLRELYEAASKREKLRKELRLRLEKFSSAAETADAGGEGTSDSTQDEGQIEQFCPDLTSTRNMLLKCSYTERRDKGAPHAAIEPAD